MYDIIFVILIYKLYDEVGKCIASIRKRIDTDSFHFVIVDNGSPNGVGRRLRKKYEGDETVHVLLLEENVGFARGNNAGIALARELGAKYICCLNDDTRLLSPRLVATLNEKYAQYHPAVIGPRVLEQDVNESAFNHRLKDIPAYEKRLRELEQEQYTESALESLRHFAKRSRLLTPLLWLWHHRKKPLKCPYQTDTAGLVLYGCCLFFTPLFFTELSGFDPVTFLYCEEDFLYLAVQRHHMQTLYTPDIAIAHCLSASTLHSFKKRKEAWAFRKKHMIESRRILIAYLKAHRDEIYPG